MNVPQFRPRPKAVSLLLTTVLIASVSVLCNCQTSPIKGIKIKKSSFDSQIKKVELEFINDRAADITAYHYCVNVASSDPKISGPECVLVDTLSAVLDWKADMNDRPGANANSLSDVCSMPQCNAVHPGETRTIAKRIGYPGVLNATVIIDLVSWSDNTFDGDVAQMQALVAERSAQLQVHQLAAKTIKDALAKQSETTLVPTAIAALQAEQQRTPVVKLSDDTDARTIKKYAIGLVIDSLRKPEKNKGNDAEYVPDNQREFLSAKAKHHDYLAAEFAKNITLQKVGGQ